MAWNTTKQALEQLPQCWMILKKVEALTKQFSLQHRYFSKTWLMLTEKQKNKFWRLL